MPLALEAPARRGRVLIERALWIVVLVCSIPRWVSYDDTGLVPSTAGSGYGLARTVLVVVSLLGVLATVDGVGPEERRHTAGFLIVRVAAASVVELVVVASLADIVVSDLTSPTALPLATALASSALLVVLAVRCAHRGDHHAATAAR